MECNFLAQKWAPPSSHHIGLHSPYLKNGSSELGRTSFSTSVNLKPWTPPRSTFVSSKLASDLWWVRYIYLLKPVMFACWAKYWAKANIWISSMTHGHKVRSAALFTTEAVCSHVDFDVTFWTRCRGDHAMPSSWGRIPKRRGILFVFCFWRLNLAILYDL